MTRQQRAALDRKIAVKAWMREDLGRIGATASPVDSRRALVERWHVAMSGGEAAGASDDEAWSWATEVAAEDPDPFTGL